MNIIDLRDFMYNGDNIIQKSNDYFIFYNIEEKDGNYERVFYNYNLKNNEVYQINKNKIPTSDEACYVHYFEKNKLYTTAFTELEENVYSNIWEIDLESGKCNLLKLLSGNMEVFFLNGEYAIAKGNNFEIDDYHKDEKALASGEYDFAYLVELKNDSLHEIKDKKILWGLNDIIFTYEINNEINVFFEESYMETWELQDAFDMGIKKEHIYKEGYKESLNTIKLDLLIKEIKECKENINFQIIDSTSYSGSIRFFGKMDNVIYYRKHNFNDNLMEIYKYSIETQESIKIKTLDLSKYVYRGLYYSSEEQRIFYEDNYSEKIRITEILNESLDIELDEDYEEYVNVIENRYIITSSCEEEDEENMRYYVNIKDKESNKKECFEGFCDFVFDNLVLFS